MVYLLNNLSGYSNSERFAFKHFTNEDGLPSSYIKKLCQDHYGFIWAATRSSVCRFDGKYFKTFQAQDNEGNTFDLWAMDFFGYEDSSLIALATDNRFYYFDFETEYFRPHPFLNEIGQVSELITTAKGTWVIRNNETQFLRKGAEVLQTFSETVSWARIAEGISVKNLRQYDSKLVALSSDNRIHVFDTENKIQRSYDLPGSFEASEVTDFLLDQNNFAWITNSEAGIYLINLTNGRAHHFTEDNKYGQRLLHNLVHCVSEDQTGRVWIGTENGLCIWSHHTESFEYYQYNINNPEGLNTNPIYDIFCDKDGNMWLGTYFGGINFWSNNREFFRIWQAGTGDNHIGGNAVSCITEDTDGNVWIGMEDMGLNKIDRETGRVYRFKSDNSGLSFNNVHCLLFENLNTLWIGTYTGGINILDLPTGKFSYIDQGSHPELPGENIYSMVQRGDSIYIGTSGGLAVYNTKSRKLSRFSEDPLGSAQVEFINNGGDRIWFSSLAGIFSYNTRDNTVEEFNEFPSLRHVNFVKTDSKGRIWVGDCLEGLCGFDPLKGEKMQFNEKTGFPFSWIFSMEEGSDGSMWVSGDKGLVNLKPGTGELSLFNRESGLPFEQFNFRASFIDSRGDIYFGGNNGMVSFNENSRQNESLPLKVVFRGMQLFNQPLLPGTDRALSRSLNMDPVVQLKYKQNVFTIEYAGLSFQNAGSCQYAYYLEGFENDWNYVGNRDFATYTNLSPGDYVFHVKATNDNTDWAAEPTTLHISIEPPFWLSNWGFLLYFVLLVLLLFAIYNITTRIQKSKALVEMERREKEYATEINNFKLEFFTNVSHELRTPLTLIVGPLTRILQEEKLAPGLVKKMKGIKNNAYRLLSLINQLLEFRKIETGKETLKVGRQNITQLIQDIEESFAGSAKTTGVKLKVWAENLDREIWVDGMKLENILINLVSNALKFTEKGGKVGVSLLVKEESAGEMNLYIEVSDTGVGISEEKKEKIFERFYKDEMNVNPGGSGIGLAYVNSLIKIHRGTIEVESEEGKGTTFKVVLPVSRGQFADHEIVLGQTQFNPELNPLLTTETIPDQKDNFLYNKSTPTVLVVDDNEELLAFIMETLKGNYKITTAKSGEEALEKIDEQMPELIISDVMMPGIDGFELCTKLKNELKTSHIPVVLLTAKSGEESEYEGLKTGADYFVEKPFFPHILSQLIDNILATRKNLIERFKSDINMLPTEAAHSDSDRDLIERITQLILKNIDHSDLDVGFVVNEIGISRSLLHIKLKNLTGCSATEFIRSIRLRQAVKLIADGTCNISEAAYQTGFSSPTYFTRRFKEFFGTTPKQYFDHL